MQIMNRIHSIIIFFSAELVEIMLFSLNCLCYKSFVAVLTEAIQSMAINPLDIHLGILVTAALCVMSSPPINAGNVASSRGP